MSDSVNGDEDSSMLINTLNQAQQTKKISAKKDKINLKKNLKKDKLTKKKTLKEKKQGLKSEKKIGTKKIVKKEVLRSDEAQVDAEPAKFERTHTPANTSKNAKFSSLFKNNHEIPRVGDTEAKTVVKEDLFSSNQFSNLNLSPHLSDCLEKRFKLKKMTQIQEKSIPAILAGNDCFVKSQTGSGKTLAYAIPIVQQLQARLPRLKRTDGIRALVLVPTRELAIQTCEVFEKLCNACVWIVAGCLIGGMKKKSEKDRIRRGLNILVATPGRLCDHLDTTMALDLSKVDYLIFDEADRMLDMDFEKKINFIIFKLHSAKKQAIAEPEPPRYVLDANGEPVEEEFNPNNAAPKRIDPQTILISATLTSGIHEIARRLNIKNPVHLDASDSTSNDIDQQEDEGERNEEKIALPTGLSHYYVIVPSKLRLIGLISLILGRVATNSKANNKIVIFAATNDSVQFHENILSTFLNRKFNMYLDDEDNYDSDLDSQFMKKETTANKVCDLFSLYGNMDQHKRAEILKRFCKASSGVLVCTDVAARGLDMPNVDYIIQYNTPGSCVDYVHRVGRTARSGHKGKAIIFLEPCEIEYLKKLNELGISLSEIKLESTMDCLNEESKYYPRQVNSDRLVFARNAEECANSMQFYIEEYVEKSGELQTLARKAYLSFLRSYSCYSHEWKSIFHIKNLHIGHVAKSFGIREAPNQIAGNELKLFKGRKVEVKPKSSSLKAKEFEDEEYDRLASKYARDLKRLTNNHKEYGNVTKKNKLRSQKADIDLSGLLKNHKSISEFTSGTEGAATFKQANSMKRSFSNVSTERTEPKPKIKIVKKNMAIFD